MKRYSARKQQIIDGENADIDELYGDLLKVLGVRLPAASSPDDLRIWLRVFVETLNTNPNGGVSSLDAAHAEADRVLGLTSAARGVTLAHRQHCARRSTLSLTKSYISRVAADLQAVWMFDTAQRLAAVIQPVGAAKPAAPVRSLVSQDTAETLIFRSAYKIFRADGMNHQQADALATGRIYRNRAETYAKQNGYGKNIGKIKNMDAYRAFVYRPIKLVKGS